MPPISCLYASPLNRAWQTAQPIAQRQGFFRRVAGAIDEIVGRPPGETVAVVPHGGALRAGLAHLLPETMNDCWDYALDNDSLTCVRTGHRGNHLVALNDRQHLEDA